MAVRTELKVLQKSSAKVIKGKHPIKFDANEVRTMAPVKLHALLTLLVADDETALATAKMTKPLLKAILVAYAKEGETAGFATGGADGVVLLWAARYERLRAIDLNALCRRGGLLDAFGRPKLLPPARGVRVSAVCWDVGDRRLLVGTQHNEVVRLDDVEIGGVDGAIQTTLLTQGHGGGRVRGGPARLFTPHA